MNPQCSRIRCRNFHIGSPQYVDFREMYMRLVAPIRARQILDQSAPTKYEGRSLLPDPVLYGVRYTLNDLARGIIKDLAQEE